MRGMLPSGFGRVAFLHSLFFDPVFYLETIIKGLLLVEFLLLISISLSFAILEGTIKQLNTEEEKSAPNPGDLRDR